MSLPEVLLTLAGQRDRLRRTADALVKVSQNSILKADYPDLRLDASTALRRIAGELDGQLRTADRPFTIALVGEFSVGKSTVVNALLNLDGSVALSAKDDPDTACSVLLCGRGEGDPEARLHFEDGTREDTTWQRASRLASQVWLADHPEDASVSDDLVEIEYFVASEVLAGIAINDLPGTGSRYWERHTALTHRKMKEADAILWVVGEPEPSAESVHDLRVLGDCRQRVHPLVNVWEDPEVGIARDEAAVARAVARLKKNFGTLFAGEPICVAARVIQLERAKGAPSRDVLRRAGWDDLVQVVDALRGNGTGGDRLHRVCGASIALGNEACDTLLGSVDTLDAWITRIGAASTQATSRFDDIGSVHDDVRGRVRGLARERAIRISHHVGAAGAAFVEDTLQIDNWSDIGTTLRWRGRELLEAQLKQRFLAEYLQLDKQPSWLDELGAEYAEEVRMVVVPAWRQLLARLPAYTGSGANIPTPRIEIGPLGQALVKAVFNVLARVLGIIAIGGMLAMIPGGVIIDVVAILGLLILSAISDPLAGARRRAVERVRLQADAQQHEIQNRLFEAGLEGNAVIEAAVRAALQAGSDRATESLGLLHELRGVLSEGEESMRTSIQTFNDLLRGSR
ncbi:MAG: dynamin family protein [Myxococcota bacterium]